MGGFQLDILTQDEALAGIGPDWHDLWTRSPGATPFGAPAWLLPWWAAFRPGELRTVALRREGRLVALAPLYLEDGPYGRRLLPMGIGISDHLDVLLDPAAGPATADLLVRAVADMADWTSWELEDLAPGAAAWSLPAPPGCAEAVSDQTACPVLASLGDGLSAVPPRQRRKIRMARHRAERRGGRIDHAAPDGMAAFLDTLASLHAARWHGEGEPGLLADPRVRAFHRAAMPGLAAAGLCRATTLTIEGRTAGAYYGLRHRGAAYAYLGGFDPDFAFESPGTVLMADALEASARDGATEFHFLRGQEPYKYVWGGADRANRRRSFRRT